MDFINSTEFLGVDYTKADCTTRAIAICLGSSYNEADDFLKEVFDKQHGQGIRTKPFLDYLEDNTTTLHKCYHYSKSDLTFNRFRRDIMDKNKTYLIVVHRHSFAVKNGIIYGNWSDAKVSRKKLLGVFEF